MVLLAAFCPVVLGACLNAAPSSPRLADTGPTIASASPASSERPYVAPAAVTSAQRASTKRADFARQLLAPDIGRTFPLRAHFKAIPKVRLAKTETPVSELSPLSVPIDQTPDSQYIATNGLPTPRLISQRFGTVIAVYVNSESLKPALAKDTTLSFDSSKYKGKASVTFHAGAPVSLTESGEKRTLSYKGDFSISAQIDASQVDVAAPWINVGGYSVNCEGVVAPNTTLHDGPNGEAILTFGPKDSATPGTNEHLIQKMGAANNGWVEITYKRPWASVTGFVRAYLVKPRSGGAGVGSSSDIGFGNYATAFPKDADTIVVRRGTPLFDKPNGEDIGVATKKEHKYLAEKRVDGWVMIKVKTSFGEVFPWVLADGSLNVDTTD